MKSVASFKHHLNDSHIMAPTFGTLAALILLFAAFVANKNKEAIEETNSKLSQNEDKPDLIVRPEASMSWSLTSLAW